MMHNLEKITKIQAKIADARRRIEKAEEQPLSLENIKWLGEIGEELRTLDNELDALNKEHTHG